MPEPKVETSVWRTVCKAIYSPLAYLKSDTWMNTANDASFMSCREARSSVCESSVRFLSLLSRIDQATANLPALCRFTATQRLHKSITNLPSLSDCFSLRIDRRVHSWVSSRSKFVCSQDFVKIPEFRIGGVVARLINGMLSTFVAVLHRAFAQVICQRVCWCQSLRDWRSGNVYCSKEN